MAQIRKYPFIRHLRGDPSFHIMRYRKGHLREAGPGLSFWFQPLDTSVVEIPTDHRDLPFLYHARSGDFQLVNVQGVITFRVQDPARLAERVDFSVDPDTGLHREQPLDKLAGLVTELAQQFTWDYLAHSPLVDILEHGFDEIRGRIERGLEEDAGLADMGIAVITVRVSAVRAQADVEKALQTPTRESIQQRADEATFERRALAVEKERAIAENELQSEIELARREETLIEQRGKNERSRARETAEADRIAAEARAERTTMEAHAQAESITTVEGARVESERERMSIYRDFPADRLLGLAAQRLAGKLGKIEHLNLSPDLLGGLLTRVMSAGAERLETKPEA